MKESKIITDRRVEHFGPIVPTIAPIVPPPRQRDEPRPLPIEWLEDIKPQLIGMWLIKKLLPAQGLALIYGHPGSGKSFLAIDFAMHVALGWEWQGRAVKQGLVIYVGAEGHVGIRNRLTAFRLHHEIESRPPFALVPCPIDLQAAGTDADRLISAIRTAIEHYKAEPVLIVIDTISKTFGTGKENTDDMAVYVANCGRIAAEFACCVLPVHHRPKDSENLEPRGHGSLKGGVDTVILVEAGKPKSALVTKQKDGEEGERFRFNLRPIELGADEDGEVVTSCIVEPTEADYALPSSPQDRAKGKLSDNQRIVLAQLGDTLQRHGYLVPADIPDEKINRRMITKVASVEAWRDQYISVLIEERDQRDQDRDQRDNIRRGFNKAKDRLLSLGIIGLWEGSAWIV